MKNQVNLLESLIRIPSPSGYEEEIAEFINQKLLKILPKSAVTVDMHNNVIAVVKGISDKTIMIDAHTDQIGFVVNNVDPQGFITLLAVGGHDRSVLTARDLIILTDKGVVHGVVNRRHAHLVDEDHLPDIIKMEEAAVDIGPRSKRKVKSTVRIGDGVVYDPMFHHLQESFYAGTGMDDKAGCWVVFQLIKRIVKSQKRVLPTMVFTFSAQEETGGRKLRPVIRKYSPDLFAVLARKK